MGDGSALGVTDGDDRYIYGLKSTQITNLLFLSRAMSLNLGSKGHNSVSYAIQSGNLELLRAYAGTYYLNTW
jgi:hypothetical protein